MERRLTSGNASASNSPLKILRGEKRKTTKLL